MKKFNCPKILGQSPNYICGIKQEINISLIFKINRIMSNNKFRKFTPKNQTSDLVNKVVEDVKVKVVKNLTDYVKKTPGTLICLPEPEVVNVNVKDKIITLKWDVFSMIPMTYECQKEIHKQVFEPLHLDDTYNLVFCGSREYEFSMLLEVKYQRDKSNNNRPNKISVHKL